MASTHKSLRSSTASKRPTTAIADGQIALNTSAASPGLFFKDSTGATIIKVGPVHVGTTAPNATPAAGGSSGNSTGEVWLDTSLTPVGVKIWNGSAWVNATPTGSTTVQGLLELATNAETQTGIDTAKAVTPAGLQSKVSDSTSTTSSTTIASSTAVKAAYDLANAALPKAGGTVTGALNISETGSLVFEGATADEFETTLGVVDPTADRTINLPDVNGTVITTGDNGTVTSTMIADGTIVDADISASAEIAVSKLADGAARQVLQTDAAGTGVEWTDSIALPGSASATSFNPTGSSVPTNGIYLPTTNTVALSTNGTKRIEIQADGDIDIDGGGVFYDATNNRLAVGTTSPSNKFVVSTSNQGLEVSPGSTNTLLSYDRGATAYLPIRTRASSHAFSNASTDFATIDSSGRLLVGTSSSIGAGASIQGSSSTAGFQLELFRHSSDANGSLIRLTKARGTQGSPAKVNADDTLGGVYFGGYDGAAYRGAAYILAAADAEWGTGGDTTDNPTRLVFFTTADGDSSPTERFRIDSSGRLLVGTSTSIDNTASIQTYKASGANTIISETGSLGNNEVARLLVKCSSPARFGQFAVAKHSGITNPVAYIDLNQEDGNQSFFWFDNSAIARTSPTFGHVGTTSGTVIGTQTSDERMKNVGNNVTYGLAEIKQLQPKQYSLKTEPDVNKLGFIAQDVELIIPEAVYDTAVELKDHQDGDRTMLSMEYVQLIPVLVNAVKELSAEVDALKTQLQVL